MNLHNAFLVSDGEYFLFLCIVQPLPPSSPSSAATPTPVTLMTSRRTGEKRRPSPYQRPLWGTSSLLLASRITATKSKSPGWTRLLKVTMNSFILPARSSPGNGVKKGHILSPSTPPQEPGAKMSQHFYNHPANKARA